MKEYVSEKQQLLANSTDERLVQLMDQYGNMIIRLAYTYVKQKEAAEDISQEVFISCYKQLDNFEEKATYKTWLYKITVNKCKDYLKSWSKRNLFSMEFNKLVYFHSTNQEGEEKSDREIFDEVMKLPIKQREVIILHYYEEFSIQEISELLKLNCNTIKTRLHRGRNKLRQIVSEVKIGGETV